MPPQPQWLLRVPEILEDLKALEIPVLDRASVERLFALKRWQAVQLLHHFGGYQVGRTFLVDRQKLIQQLAQIHAGEAFTYEQQRRERVILSDGAASLAHRSR